MNRKLIVWSVFIGLIAALNYTANFSAKKDTGELYQYSTAISGAALYVVWLGIVLWITGRNSELLALRRPASWPAAVGLAVVVLFVAYLAIWAIDPVLHGGREQGAIPKHWQPAHAGAYAANWFVVAAVAPVVEELTFRGLGYSLFSNRIGKWPAILAIGLFFAAAHGLVQAFPELAILGCGLAWLRSRTGSVYPGMAVHAAFNSIALSAVFFSTAH
jgi:uncharacterized protein